MKNIWVVFIVFLVLLGFVLTMSFAFGESAGRVPVRISPPMPGGLAETPLPSKKAQQAKALRKAAEALEEAAIRDMDDLFHTNSNRLAAVNYSTDKFEMKVKAISFYEVGTNVQAQITFDYSDK